MGFVADLKNDLGDLGRCEAGGGSGKRAEVTPPGFRAAVLEN